MTASPRADLTREPGRTTTSRVPTPRSSPRAPSRPKPPQAPTRRTARPDGPKAAEPVRRPVGAQRPSPTGPVGRAGRAPRPAPPPARAPFVILVLTLATAGLVALVLLNTAINENAFRLHDLQTRQQALDLTEQQLERDVAALESPGSLAAAARRLGLVPAGTPAFIRLPDGQVLGVPTPAGAAGPGSPAGRPSAAARPPAGAPRPSTAPTPASAGPAAASPSRPGPGNGSPSARPAVPG